MNAQNYNSLAADTSWSWFGGSDWRQTFSPSPKGANIWQEFLHCESGYERNADTKRCQKIVTNEAVADCGEGKYRSPETNRCRGLVSLTVMTPCKEGQIRNPETNCCRSVATAASALALCKEGQERNPVTNRCRNVTKSIPDSAFAAEPLKDNASTFAGWWALGGVSTLALGYGIWEWRCEMLGGVQKLGLFFAFHK